MKYRVSIHLASGRQRVFPGLEPDDYDPYDDYLQIRKPAGVYNFYYHQIEYIFIEEDASENV